MQTKALYPAMTYLRGVKTKAEIAVMRYANRVSSAAHVAVMQTVKPGMMEYQLESMFKHHCYFYGRV